MLGQNTAATSYQINQYYNDRVGVRKSHVHKSVHIIAKIVQEILKDVEALEPRFISTLVEQNGRYEGIMVHSPSEYEVILYLNQMGVFNFVDDGSIPGCAVLKLSDGRKRSMSLWVEFITASGYLSARKIRSRFQALVGQSIEKSQYRDICKLMTDTTDVKLRIQDKYTVQITCAFRCNGIWPRSANQWPRILNQWTGLKNEGFDLFSKETNAAQCQPNKQTNSMEGDAWAMNSHLDFVNTPITNYILKTLLLFECEKHSKEHEWEEAFIGDRVIGVLLQLVSCLQCRKCPHYFLPQLDLLRNKPSHLLDQSAKLTWNLVRQLMLNSRALENL
ncbi:unnamed protein product [Enterobius vermicularis]|uniref:Mab-21 domain-containing protein n=1 Tax=Enterobius vermicularis TaxID=51028 RepID=A0A0N4V842_ENTVE|nr:unnamed protein product [Enterobius vermicularis]